MRVSSLDLHCLTAMADDYETVASIAEDVRRSSHDNLDEADFAACVAELLRDGLADAFRLTDATGEYVRTSMVPDHADGLWFHITDRGRCQLDENWVEE